MGDPIKQITTRSQKENLNVATPKIGEIVDYRKIETYQEHWWENVEYFFHIMNFQNSHVSLSFP